MELKDAVLEILEGGQVVSGGEMAQKLGVSRNSVWKAIHKLKEGGYEIEAGTNRGYRLVSGSLAFTPENIRTKLKGSAAAVAIDLRESVTSTNTVLKEMGEKGGREGMVLIAKRQTAGKGRLGRSFHSPKNTGLYMSVLLRPKFPAEEALLITTAAAVAVSEAVDAVTGKTSQIKWVNDVYLGGKKICGILTEAAVDFENGGLHYAVLGMGVNIQPPEEGIPTELREIVGTLFPEKAPAGKSNELAAEILNRFFGFYENLPSRKFMENYRQRSLLTGMNITFTRGNAVMKGTVLGIDENARLGVLLENGEQEYFSAGEVSVTKDFLQQLQCQEKEKRMIEKDFKP